MNKILSIRSKKNSGLRHFFYFRIFYLGISSRHYDKAATCVTMSKYNLPATHDDQHVETTSISETYVIRLKCSLMFCLVSQWMKCSIYLIATIDAMKIDTMLKLFGIFQLSISLLILIVKISLV